MESVFNLIIALDFTTNPLDFSWDQVAAASSYPLKSQKETEKILFNRLRAQPMLKILAQISTLEFALKDKERTVVKAVPTGESVYSQMALRRVFFNTCSPSWLAMGHRCTANVTPSMNWNL